MSFQSGNTTAGAVLHFPTGAPATAFARAAGKGLLPVLIVLHQETSSPGRVGNALRALGHPLDIRRPRFGDCLPETLDDHAGAVIFGGPMSANDPDDFVRREIDWIAVPLREQRPFLGICLGAQMLAMQLGATRAPSCMASICAPRQIPRNGRCSLSGTAIHSISRRTKSSGSFALIGPPKMTAPAWPSSVGGSGSPKRGRLISSRYPSARNALPTRPGVEVSWCRMIRTGRKGWTTAGAPGAARGLPGRCSTLSASVLID